MDSTVDILKLRDDHYLQAQGEAIAEGLAIYFKLQLLTASVGNQILSPKEGTNKLYTPSSQSLINSTSAVLKRLEKMPNGPLSATWHEKLLKGTLTDSDAIGLLYVAIERGLLVEGK